MNWFKKVFKQFASEEEELNQVEESVEAEQQPKMESTAWKKEIDSKIIYQYPKGNFRFPLIPDEEIDDKKEMDRRKRREPRQAFQENRRENDQPFKRPYAEQTKSDQKEEKVSNTYSTNRPFKPTEVVSPIYGYNRPERKAIRTTESRPIIEKKVEISKEARINQKEQNKTRGNEELLTFVGMNDEVVESQEVRQNVEIAESQKAERNVEAAEPQEEERNVESSELQEAEKNVEVAELQEAERNIESAETQEAGQQHGEIHVETVELHKAETAVAQETVTVDRIMEQDTSFSIKAEEYFAEEITSRADSALEIENVASLSVFAREAEKEVNEQVESLIEDQELDNNQSLLKFEEAEVVEEVYQENDEELVVEKKEEASQAKIEEKKTISRKGPLPFNVLMLNKDRKRLANQQVEKKICEEPKPQSQAEVVVPSMIEKEDEEQNDLPYYVFPEENLLNPPILQIEKDGWIEEQTMLLNDTFTNFNVHAKVVNVTQGPSVTRYEVQPEPGVKVSKITNLSDDLKLSLAAKDIRIEAPIPGKHTVGIEVPNQKSRPVLIREILESEEFKSSASPLTVAMGLDISGKPIVTDLRKMPHGLIAGATGSGKSVCINTMLVSLLYKAKPEELKLLLVDPKMVELAPYNYVPHLASPVITDVKTATAALKWAVEEMERRYELLAHAGVRDITKYNQLAEEHKRYSEKLPYLVIVIDELADLMMMAPADVEEAISRIAQKARACGIHLLIATQRPSVDVITGLIKANVPTRIAFSVSSQIDSRTVIDISGAEKLLGKGDMLFLENGTSKPVRLQGTFVSDEEIDQVVAHVRKERKPEYLFEQEDLLKKVQMSEEEDELFYEACEFIIEQGGASTSSLQRKFKIGYNRAARLIDMMEKQGFISEARGTKPRDVLITESELLLLQENE
ncbi:cell division FtsK/SpoIIIE [Niallia circulans]|uniref:DNA translocase FtsK n=1 Tax=Niallia TaxID=2837506 RepID=UPI00077C5D4F|nr:DNA translocase FtsK [Niallia circulans]MDR4317236.1 DNA translocase FtsK [Niallia circulans]MED3838726.1 DNA translocase FtsK [Niallia circulans]MED4245122.1 DNA translocase FtsK [Niallia circulans]MED4248729.1 DNA translocase FtsK [Niallia circulans]MED5103297.1 DNA translocase FtsK [Niallia circulans]